MKYRIGGKNLKTNEIKQLKRKEAEERSEKRKERSHVQQIEKLDTLFGKDIGAVKERIKLYERIEKEKVHQEKKKKIKK